VSAPRLLLLVLCASASACVRTTPPAIAPVAAGSCRSVPLKWLAPEDARERARLDAWCAGVGGAAVHDAPLNSGTSNINAREITFVSWNVHVGNGDVRAFVNDLRRGILSEPRDVRHYVLMLQEAVRTHGVPPLASRASGASRIPAHAQPTSIDIVDISRELGLSLVYVPSMRNGSSANEPHEDRGSAILSTLPLSDPVAIELPGERQRRVAIVAKTGPVSVAVVHLDPLGSAKRLRLFWTPWMRELQARTIASALPAGPLVVGADLNTWHGRDEPAARTLAKFFRSTPLSIERRGLGLRVLDYMFLRGDAGVRAHYREIANRYGSDHRPLVGWFQ
jgi:endonuclease/exonuclease/phosphatase family metal-dependent hydrolase